MEPSALVVADIAALKGREEDLREMCRAYASYFSLPVELVLGDRDAVRALRGEAAVRNGTEAAIVEPASAVSAAPMAAAEFIWREDGSPDWGAMWQGFCDLALYGGPPHRGSDNPVFIRAEALEAETMTLNDMVMEIRRGIWETTGLFAEVSPPSWLAITCGSRQMAAWMCASIILENVDARCDEERLYVPAHASFELKNQVKSVITVVAKVNHYWQAHVLSNAPAQTPACN